MTQAQAVKKKTRKRKSKKKIQEPSILWIDTAFDDVGDLFEEMLGKFEIVLEDEGYKIKEISSRQEMKRLLERIGEDPDVAEDLEELIVIYKDNKYILIPIWL